MPVDRIDWTRLCNHSGIIFAQRIVLTASIALGVPVMIWTASTFVQMRDAMLESSRVLAETRGVLSDHENRIRAVERDTWRRGEKAQ